MQGPSTQHSPTQPPTVPEAQTDSRTEFGEGTGGLWRQSVLRARRIPQTPHRQSKRELCQKEPLHSQILGSTAPGNTSCLYIQEEKWLITAEPQKRARAVTSRAAEVSPCPGATSAPGQPGRAAGRGSGSLSPLRDTAQPCSSSGDRAGQPRDGAGGNSSGDAGKSNKESKITRGANPPGFQRCLEENESGGWEQP